MALCASTFVIVCIAGLLYGYARANHGCSPRHRCRAAGHRLTGGSCSWFVPTDDLHSPLELVGDHHGLVVLGIARAEDEGDRVPKRPLGEGIECLRPIGVGELCAVARLELRPTRRVVSEPPPEFGARTEVSGPVIEPESLLRPSARPDAVHQDAVSAARGRFVVGPLQSDVAERGGHRPAPGSGCRCETYEPTGRRKPTEKRFQPLMATMASVSATCSAGSNSRAIAS